MSIRAIDSDGEWVFGIGKQSYKTGDLEIAQDIETKYKTFTGELFWDRDFGMPWWSILGEKNPVAYSRLMSSSRNILANVNGVYRINSLEADFDPKTRKASLKYSINTVNGTTYKREVVLNA